MTLAEFVIARIAEDAASPRSMNGTVYRDLGLKQWLVSECLAYCDGARTGDIYEDNAPDWALEILLHVAVGYDGHADYDEAWRPWQT